MNAYLKTIYNFILLHVRSEEDAKDILQETMLGIWRSLSGFDKKSSFRTWIYAIARRKIFDYYRKSYRSMDNCREEISELGDELYSYDAIEQLADTVTVQDAVNSLSDEEKELVYLVFSAQLTYREVKELTGLPEGTIKSKMFGIRKKLKNVLKEGGY